VQAEHIELLQSPWLIELVASILELSSDDDHQDEKEKIGQWRGGYHEKLGNLSK
jgi:hypothetical protein